MREGFLGGGGEAAIDFGGQKKIALFDEGKEGVPTSEGGDHD